MVYFCTPRRTENNKGKEYSESHMFVFHTGWCWEGNTVPASFPGELAFYDCMGSCILLNWYWGKENSISAAAGALLTFGIVLVWQCLSMYLFFFLMFQEINNVFIYLVHSFLVFLKFLNSLLSAQQCLGIILQNYAYQNALLNLLHSGVPGSLSQESVRFLDLWWWVQAPLWT